MQISFPSIASREPPAGPGVDQEGNLSAGEKNSASLNRRSFLKCVASAGAAGTVRNLVQPLQAIQPADRSRTEDDARYVAEARF
jgi:hypothetical protein